MKRISKTILVVSFALLILLPVSRGGGAGGVEIPAQRWYLQLHEGRPVGYVRVNRVPSMGDSAEVVFEHEMFSNLDGKRIKRTMRTHCQNDDYYFPVKATALIDERGKGPASVTATVEKKIPYGASKAKMGIIYRTGGKEYRLNRNIPQHTVPSHLLIEIIPLLPFQKGTVFEFNLFDLEKLSAKRMHKVEYLGTEEVRTDEQSRRLHKFAHKGPGVKKTYYSVDENHLVIRVVRGSKDELLLSTDVEVGRIFPEAARRSYR